MRHLTLTGLATLALLAATGAQAQVKVGIITSLSGPVASIGIPYDKGYKAWEAGGTEVAGKQLQLIEIDDASDPSAAARAARKLIEEDHVDVVLGAASTPSSLSVYNFTPTERFGVDERSRVMVKLDHGAWKLVQ